jgi:hypothetical protein
MKITRFDGPTLKTLRTALDSALKPVGEQYGIVLSLGTISFSDADFRVRLTGALAQGAGGAGKVDKSRKEFERYADLLGLNKTDLGKTFTFRGKRYEIVGAKLSARKYPILAKQVGNGRVYKFQERDVARLLGKPVRPFSYGELQAEAAAEARAEALAS